MLLFKLQKKRGVLSGNKDKCTDNTCNTEEQSKPPSANGNSTTPATTSTTGAESTANNTTPEGRKATENNSKNKTLYVKPRLI
jgi:hypothetical protein